LLTGKRIEKVEDELEREWKYSTVEKINLELKQLDLILALPLT
jgi:hypothetical protein